MLRIVFCFISCVVLCKFIMLFRLSLKCGDLYLVGWCECDGGMGRGLGVLKLYVLGIERLLLV